MQGRIYLRAAWAAAQGPEVTRGPQTPLKTIYFDLYQKLHIRLIANNSQTMRDMKKSL